MIPEHLPAGPLLESGSAAGRRVRSSSRATSPVQQPGDESGPAAGRRVRSSSRATRRGACGSSRCCQQRGGTVRAGGSCCLLAAACKSRGRTGPRSTASHDIGPGHAPPHHSGGLRPCRRQAGPPMRRAGNHQTASLVSNPAARRATSGRVAARASPRSCTMAFRSSSARSKSSLNTT